jgi:phospholipase/lecithinase/hemolysin
LCAIYNQALADALQNLAANGIPTIQVDAFATLQAMVNSPAEFGFTNVTVPLLAVLLGGGHPNPTEFLFWDSVHPTTRGHEVLGRDALNSIIDYYSPSQGHGSPAARVNALKGLIHAGKP